MTPAINFVLSVKDGTVTVFPEGVKGKKCLEFTKPFEDALGLDSGKGKKRPEYYQEEKTKQNVRT